jgi:cold shock CspA family protein
MARQASKNRRVQLCVALEEECWLDLKNRGVYGKVPFKRFKIRHGHVFRCATQLAEFHSDMMKRWELLQEVEKLRGTEILGTIKTFARRNGGKGFLIPDGGKINVIIRGHLLPHEGLFFLHAGQRVRCTVVESERRLVAEQLKFVSPEDDSLQDLGPWAQELAARHHVEHGLIRLLAAEDDVGRRWLLGFDLHHTADVNSEIRERLRVKKADRPAQPHTDPLRIELKSDGIKVFEDALMDMWRKGELSWQGVYHVRDALCDVAQRQMKERRRFDLPSGQG